MRTICVVAVVLSLSLAACGGEEPDDVASTEQAILPPPPPPPPPGTLPMPAPVCGDGLLNALAGEECETTKEWLLQSTTSCASLGLGTGLLACDKTTCKWDTGGCFSCGDGVKHLYEQCEGSDLGGKTCQTQGFEGGTLSCTSGCALDTSGCYRCGDGEVNGPNEECDGGVGSKTCADFGFDGGRVTCRDCKLSTSLCTKCGDGKKEGSEECDGSDFGGLSCESMGYADPPSALACNGNCTVDKSGCTDPWDPSSVFHISNYSDNFADSTPPFDADAVYATLTCDDLFGTNGTCKKCGYYSRKCLNRCLAAGYHSQEYVAWLTQRWLLENGACIPSPDPLLPPPTCTPATPPPDPKGAFDPTQDVDVPPEIELVDWEACFADINPGECVQARPYCKKCSDCQGGCGFWKKLSCIVRAGLCAAGCVTSAGASCVFCAARVAYSCASCLL